MTDSARPPHERLWSSVKYENVYLHAYESVSEAKHRLVNYFLFYNTLRPHSSLGGLTPDMTYFINCAGPDFSGHEFGVKSCLRKELCNAERVEGKWGCAGVAGRSA